MKKFLTVAFIAMLMVCICVGGALIAQAEVLDHDHVWVDGSQGTKECSDPNCDAVCTHANTEVWVQTGEQGAEQHYKMCSVCEAVLSVAENCGGADLDAVSCLDLPECSTCHNVYGDENGRKHSDHLKPFAYADPDHHDEYHALICPDCSDIESGQIVVIRTEAHTPGKEATCHSGTECTVCGDTYGAVNPSNHDWANARYEHTATQHQAICPCGERAPAEAHSGGTATCKAKAVCSDCGATYGDFAAHTYDNACDADCNLCGETRTPAAHVFGDWEVTKEPTETAKGSRKRTCSVCGEVETESIPVLADPNASKEPGDDSSSKTVVIIIVVVAVVLVAAGAVVAFLVVKNKKKNGDVSAPVEEAKAEAPVEEAPVEEAKDETPAEEPKEENKEEN